MDRESLMFDVKLATEAERDDEATNYMRTFIKVLISSQNQDKIHYQLSYVERKQFFEVYKNRIGLKIFAWNEITNAELKESKYENLLQKYKDVILKEVNEISNDIFQLLDNLLINNSALAEEFICYLRIKGDIYKSLREFYKDKERELIIEKAKEAYEKADKRAPEIYATNLERLRLVLSNSEFYYEVLNAPEKAITIARTGFDDAISELDSMDYEDDNERYFILQTIRDKIRLWSHSMEEIDLPNNYEDCIDNNNC